MAIVTWTYYVLAALGLGGGAIASLGAYSTNDNVRKWRGWLVVFAMMAAMLAYIQLADKVSFELRTDGVKVAFGAWYMYAIAMPFLIGSFVMSTTYDLTDVFVAGGLTLCYALSLMFATWVPSGAGHDHVARLYVLIFCAVGFLIALALWTMPLALGWSPLDWFKARSTAAPGLERVMNKGWYGLAMFIFGLILAGYILAVALSPLGFDVFPGHIDHRQLGLTIMLFVLDIALGALSLLCYFFLSQNGDVGPAAPLDMLQPMTQSGSPGNINSRIVDMSA